MKKRIFILAIMVICATSIASGTIAYFTAVDTAHNVITSSGVDVIIEEWQETEDGLVPYPKEIPIQVMPNTTVSKIVTVKNILAEAYVRATFEIVIKDELGNIKELSDKEMSSIIRIILNDEDWLRKDGDSDWWYYKKSLIKDSVSDPLFTHVIFDGQYMTNEYQNCTIDIIIEAQAVQTSNNGDSVIEAKGWPEE